MTSIFTFLASNRKVALVMDDGQVLVFSLDEPSVAPVLCPAALAAVLDFTDEVRTSATSFYVAYVSKS